MGKLNKNTKTKQCTIPSVMHPSFWFMRDNHTFYKPKGKDLNEVKKDLLNIAKDNPYGMVCPVSIIEGEKEVRKVGKGYHVDGEGNIDIEAWYNSVKDDDIVRGFDGA